MATFSHSESRRLYSWWWDSHISPKNSRWLKENLTDMDVKVKTMIKLIEEDADSFAKRAEMYYKKRPELMKLVEDFYRAYRALAERYDHATGALRQAHQTMAEAFPNQVPLMDDNSPSSDSVSQFYLSKSDSITSKKGLKQLDDLFGSGERVTKNVKFAEGRMGNELKNHGVCGNDPEHEMHVGSGDQSNYMMKEKEQRAQYSISSQNLKTQSSISESACKAEAEVQILKASLAKLEAEIESGLLQYQHAMDRLSNLEAEVSRAQDDARGLNGRASKAETEVQTLNEALIKLKAEKEAGLVQYQECAERISNLENKVSHVQEDSRFHNLAIKAETEAHSIKHALTRVEVEKEASLLQYNKCLENIINLETKLSLAEETARNLSERAVRAESEVQFLKESIVKLNEEKEVAALQWQKSLETITNLRKEVSHAQEEARRLSSVLVMGVAKLSSTEDQYLQLERENRSLQTEVDTLMEMMAVQKEELSEKHEELERLQTCLEEEYLCSMEAESALQTLHSLHSECQEERGALVLEVQNVAQILKGKELEYQGLEEDEWRVKVESSILTEQIISSVIIQKNLQDEIFRLREAEVKLDKEVEVILDQRNALQQEIYHLKKEIDELKKRHLNIIKEMELVGLTPDFLGSSVKSLHDEISRLKEICVNNDDEKVSLLEKLKNMENLFEKNANMEDSLTAVNAGLELLRVKVKALEENCQSLSRVNSTFIVEKKNLFSQLEVATQNGEKLCRKNTFLENFLFEAYVEREWFGEKSRSLEEHCLFLDNENCGLFTTNDNLVSQLSVIQQKLDDLGRQYTDLEENHSGLEKEMESKIYQIEELKAILNLQNKEHARTLHVSGSQLAHLKSYNLTLQEEGKRRMKEFEDEQDKGIEAQIEIFILQRCIQDMDERNLTVLTEYQNNSETCKSLKNLVTILQKEKFEQQVTISSLFDQVEKLRFGIRKMVFGSFECQVEIKEDRALLQLAIEKLRDLEKSLCSTQDDKLQLIFEKLIFVTLWGQLRLEAESIECGRSALYRDLKLRTEELLLLQSERDTLKSVGNHLNHQIGAGKAILSQKVMELSETDQKLEDIETKTMELYSNLKDMSNGSEEGRPTREMLETKIRNISENSTNKNIVLEYLQEAKKLELKLNGRHEDIKEQRVKEDNLSSVLLQRRNEIKLWEDEAETLYLNCQVADIHAALFKEKVHELAGACQSVEVENNSKTYDIEQLKQKLHVLKLEREGGVFNLAAYHPVVISLSDSVTSLEDRVIPQAKTFADANQDIQFADLPTHHRENIDRALTEKQDLLVADGISGLLELETRIKNIESSVVEQNRLIVQENLDKDIKLEAAMKEIQKLEQAMKESSNRKLHNTEPDFSEVGNEILVKDIPLDEVSHCSSFDHGLVPHSMRRRQGSDKNKEILELWDTMEHDFDLDLTFNQKQKLAAVRTHEKSDCLPVEPVEEKCDYPSSEIHSAKLGVLSKRVTAHQAGEKKKILERLASDAQKLMNLQVTVQDLKKRMEQSEKSPKPKDAEFNTAKGQLKEVEEAIMQLVGTNGKLSKKAEGDPMTSMEKITVNLEETGKTQKCKVSEQARRASEEIGRLQLEVQSIQFVLLRLEDKYKTKGTQVGDRKVLLKDYLYGNMRSPTKRKKGLFLGCFKPPS